jgi:hypothetical protein
MRPGAPVITTMSVHLRSTSVPVVTTRLDAVTLAG